MFICGGVNRPPRLHLGPADPLSFPRRLLLTWPDAFACGSARVTRLGRFRACRIDPDTHFHKQLSCSSFSSSFLSLSCVSFHPRFVPLFFFCRLAPWVSSSLRFSCLRLVKGEREEASPSTPHAPRSSRRLSRFRGRLCLLVDREVRHAPANAPPIPFLQRGGEKVSPKLFVGWWRPPPRWNSSSSSRLCAGGRARKHVTSSGALHVRAWMVS